MAVSFFAVLFFLCSADLFFATRIGGFNVRWGQLLLLICVLVSLWDLRIQKKLRSSVWHEHLALFKAWLPFFALYGLAAVLSPDPTRTLIKWAWALFNIGGAALLFLNQRWRRPLEQGMAWGALAIVVVLWCQLVLIYGWGVQAIPLQAGMPKHTYALFSPGIHLPTLGYAQMALNFMGIDIFRPCAFYYVPSFAACSLVFILGALAIPEKGKRVFGTIVPLALLTGAVILTTARSGFLGLFWILAYVGWMSHKWERGDVFKSLFKPVVLSLVFISLFALLPNGRKYILFFRTILEPSGISARAEDPESSEGGRLASIRHALEIWKEHPILGNGVSTETGQSPGLGQLAENTWVEIPAESGLLGLLAFLWALYRTLRGAFTDTKDRKVALLAGACLISHFLIDLNFTATFPRLDYWLIFFFYVHLLTRRENPGKA